MAQDTSLQQFWRRAFRSFATHLVIAGVCLTHLLGAGCASWRGPHAGEHTGAVPTKRPLPDVLASINGAPIYRRELRADHEMALRNATNIFEQRRLGILWSATETLIADRLIDDEAKSRGISVKALLQREIDDQLKQPTAADIQNLYDANKELLGVPLEVAQPTLVSELLRRRRETLRHTLVDALSHGADIRYELPLPDLPRFSIDAQGGPTRGPHDAPVTIVAFSDFQCPYCAQAERLLDHLSELYGDSIRYVRRDFPLERHQQAFRAAHAARCAGEQQRFWEFRALLLRRAGVFDNDTFAHLAGQAGLDVETFARCLSSDKAERAVREDISLGHRHGIDGTPVLFLNGIKLVGVLPLPIVRAFIDRELAAQRAH